jgi:hypothetical protein
MVYALSFFPFSLAPTHVDVSCLAVSQTCRIDVQRVFGYRHDQFAIDMRDVTDVRIGRSGKHDWLEAVSPRGTERVPSNFGGGRDLVLTVLQRFAASPQVDVEGAHGLDWMPIGFLALGFATCAFVTLTVIARIRIVAESDDGQMIFRVSRWPFKARVFIFAVEELVGVERRPLAKVYGKGQDDLATIELLLRDGREDLFPKGLPDRDEVQELVRKLDLFVRFGQIEDENAPLENRPIGS